VNPRKNYRSLSPGFLQRVAFSVKWARSSEKRNQHLKHNRKMIIKRYITGGSHISAPTLRELYAAEKAANRSNAKSNCGEKKT